MTQRSLWSDGPRVGHTGPPRSESKPPNPTAATRAGNAELGKLRALAVLAARHGGRVLAAQRAMIALLLARPDGAAVTIDEVRAELGQLPDRRPTWLGAVPHGLRAAGLIERAGFVESDRAASHARPVSAWRLRDRAAAAAWLREHGGPPAGGVGA